MKLSGNICYLAGIIMCVQSIFLIYDMDHLARSARAGHFSDLSIGLFMIGLRFCLHKNMGMVIDKRGILRSGQG